MKQLITIIALLFACIGCGTTRHTVRTATVVHDTVKVHDTNTVYQDKLKIEYKYIHDTLIRIQAVNVNQSFKPSDLQPWTNASGQKVPHTTTRRNGGLTSSVDVDTAGNVFVDCNQDSMILVITNLTETNTTLVDSITKMRSASKEKSNYTSATTTDIVTKPRSWIRLHAVAIVLVLVLLFIVEVVVRLFIRKKR